MQLFLFFILSIFLIFFLNYFFLKKNFLLDKRVLLHKRFTSNDVIPVSAGFLIIPSLFFYNETSVIFFICIFFLGIFSDLNLIKSPVKKIIIQFLVVSLLLLFTELRILSTKLFFLDVFIKNDIFAFVFTIFCILIVINGSNFIDGLNTLLVGYYILVVLVILYLVYYYQINYNPNFLNYLLLSLLVIFIFNFFSKTYLGDSGVFLLSFIISNELILLSNANLEKTKFVSPLFIALLLWYPAFENLFSIIRKYISKRNPGYPDNKHLHHLFFSLVKNKIKNNKTANSFSGIFINCYNFLVFFIGIRFVSQSSYLGYLLAINVLIYISCYYFLVKKHRTN